MYLDQNLAFSRTEKMQNVGRHLSIETNKWDQKKISTSLAFKAFGKAIPGARDKQWECGCVFTQVLVLKKHQCAQGGPQTRRSLVLMSTGCWQLWWQAVTAMGEEKYSVHALLICSEMVNSCEFHCTFIRRQFDWKFNRIIFGCWG